LVLPYLPNSAKADEEDNDGEDKRHDIPWHFPSAVFKLLRRCHGVIQGLLGASFAIQQTFLGSLPQLLNGFTEYP